MDSHSNSLNKSNKPDRHSNPRVCFANNSGNAVVYPIEGLSPYQNKYSPLLKFLTAGGRSEYASRINPISKNGITSVVKADFSLSTSSMKQAKSAQQASTIKSMHSTTCSRREMYLLTLS
jgi:hypothetical protein